jgi:hypothetical protein
MERGPLNRLKDHLGFAVQFVGLGYIALWPVSTPAAGDLFGASLLCKGGGGTFAIVCNLPHPLQFGIGLHFAGTLCAGAAVLMLLARAVRRARGRRPTIAPAPEAPLAPIATPVAYRPRARRRPMPPPRKVVEPRTHFGLRGVPH